jgi:hypothetical protein
LVVAAVELSLRAPELCQQAALGSPPGRVGAGVRSIDERIGAGGEREGRDGQRRKRHRGAAQQPVLSQSRASTPVSVPAPAD